MSLQGLRKKYEVKSQKTKVDSQKIESHQIKVKMSPVGLYNKSIVKTQNKKARISKLKVKSQNGPPRLPKLLYNVHFFQPKKS